MKCCLLFTIVMMAVAETLMAAVMSNQEIEENLIISRRRAAAEHDHRTDSAYSGIFAEADYVEDLKHIKPDEVKARMKTVLYTVDQNKNGMIEKHELSDKLLEIYKKLSAEESDSEFQASDIDENGYVTWEEYIGDTYASNESLEDMTREEYELFLGADMNNDNLLNQEEFRYFYTPEDYPHMQPLVMKGVMNRFDIDKDGIITFEEFIGDKNANHADHWVYVEKSKFKELDINNDGILESEEIHPWGSPNNYDIAENEAENLIFKSDKNEDGVLTFDEILNNYKAFINPESDSYQIFKDEL